MQAIRRVITPCYQYFSRLQEMGYSPRTLQNKHRRLLLTRNSMDLPLTSASSNSNLETILENMSSVGLLPDDVRNAVSVSPELLDAAPDQWDACFSLLSSYGFSCQDCLSMVTNYPKLLVTNTERITNSLTYWRNSQFGDKNVLSLLKCNPHFLFIDVKQIERRIPLLKSLTTTKRVTLLLKKCPNLMFQNWKDIQNKMTYLKEVMKIEDLDIVKSAALNLPIGDLMARHVFLERCGHFTPVKPTTTDTPVEETNANPKLSQITDTSDKRFATKVAGLTLEEYEVFQELYAAEREQGSGSEYSDSDEE